ncbi:MAG: hypothetical protein NC111_02280 [Bacteroides sp.]|nr:hypothetical protein [Bacteroides sp.]MCM1413444.1 hypothetical protein [Bacteroides sp.]MCM1471345.1 hypothetical protein [Bacteroides sp.]
MKKICLMGLGLLTSFAAVAQADLVKEVERELKGSKPDYEKALKDIQPALTNPETANTVMPWYLAGKAAFGIFDNAMIAEQTGNQLSPAQKRTAGKAYVDGYEYYMKALPLDSLPDEKGKIKPKKSKEILNTLKGGHNYLNYAANYLYDAGDWDDAYRAYNLLVTTPTNPLLAKNPPVAYPDSIQGQLMLAEAQVLLLGCQENTDSAKVKLAVDILEQIEPTGFNDMRVYQYGIIAGNMINDNDVVLSFARKGYEKFGAQNIDFVNALINDCLARNDAAGAMQYIDQALQVADPNDTNLLSQLYNAKGVVCDNSGNHTGAVEAFNKAIEANPDNLDARYKYATSILLYVDDQLAKNENLRNKDFKDDLLKAADNFEYIYNKDEFRFNGIPYALYSIYYNLGEGYVDKAKYWEMLK